MNQWITQDEIKPHRFYIDADKAYEAVMPDVLDALSAERARVLNPPESPETDERAEVDDDVPPPAPPDNRLAKALIAQYGEKEIDIDQYTLEVAHNWIKLDAQMAVKMQFTMPDRNAVQEHIIRGSEGYKDRWGWRAHPPGMHADVRKEDENKYATVVAKEARALYKEFRGYFPS